MYRLCVDFTVHVKCYRRESTPICKVNRHNQRVSYNTAFPRVPILVGSAGEDFHQLRKTYRLHGYGGSSHTAAHARLFHSAPRSQSLQMPGGGAKAGVESPVEGSSAAKPSPALCYHPPQSQVRAHSRCPRSHAGCISVQPANPQAGCHHVERSLWRSCQHGSVRQIQTHVQAVLVRAHTGACDHVSGLVRRLLLLIKKVCISLAITLSISS